MPHFKLLALTPLLILGLAACGEDQVAQQPAEPTTAEAPPAVDTTAPPPTEAVAQAPNAAPPATMTMPPSNATSPGEAPAEATGAIGGQDPDIMRRYVGRQYASDAISIRLNKDGDFEMTGNQGNQRVSGQYSVANGIVTFQNPSGNVGNAAFPMRCRLVQDGEGFRLEPVEDSCAPLEGQTFRPAS